MKASHISGMRCLWWLQTCRSFCPGTLLPVQGGFADLEEALYVPAFTVYTEDLFFAYGCIGAHYCKPLIGVLHTYKYDPCFDVFVQGICFMHPYHDTDKTYDLRRMNCTILGTVNQLSNRTNFAGMSLACLSISIRISVEDILERTRLL